MNRSRASFTRSTAEVPSWATDRGGVGLRSEFTDATVAAAVADLKSRWPRIGEAADHPLLEWFIDDQKRHPNRHRMRLLQLRAVEFIYSAGCFGFWLVWGVDVLGVRGRIFILFVLLALVALYVVMRRTPPQEKGIAVPIDMIAASKDNRVLLRMCSISTHEIAAVHVAYRYHMMLRRKALRREILHRTAPAMVLGLCIFLFAAGIAGKWPYGMMAATFIGAALCAEWFAQQRNTETTATDAIAELLYAVTFIHPRMSLFERLFTHTVSIAFSNTAALSCVILAFLTGMASFISPPFQLATAGVYFAVWPMLRRKIQRFRLSETRDLFDEVETIISRPGWHDGDDLPPSEPLREVFILRPPAKEEITSRGNSDPGGRTEKIP